MGFFEYDFELGKEELAISQELSRREERENALAYIGSAYNDYNSSYEY